MRKRIFYISVGLILIISGFLYFKSFKQRNSYFAETKKSGSITKTSEIERQAYYTMFNKEKISDGTEVSAKQVLAKIDANFIEDKDEFVDLTNLEYLRNEKLVRALYILNFVSFSSNYGTPDQKQGEQGIKDLLWTIGTSNCQTNTMLLQMLMEKAGYESRTIAINNLSHGFNEVKIDGRWQIFDATTNLWINEGFESLMAGKTGKAKEFFLKEADYDNVNYAEDTDLSILRNDMVGLGQNFKPTSFKYNYVDLSNWQY